MKTILGNTAVFVILYILFMLPTYYLPYVGSNSFLLNAVGVKAGMGINPAFWPHLGSLIILIVLARFRGALVGKTWLVIFSILAAVFDLIPGLNSIPLVPTVMHLSAIIAGVVVTPVITVPIDRSRGESREYDSSSSRTGEGENFDVAFPNMPTDALVSRAQPFEENKKTMPDNPQWVPVSQKPFCNQCGVKLEADDKFCPYCGARVS
ncbi:MAG TPA: zinc ribbon domain-containing protein [Pyrinomonadaceae bacterium]|nr:zinc ribbon domain-containing protein [Pyrinomonadaceae bacterium]